MYIKIEMDFDTLYNNSWSGAINTLNTIRENDKEDELMDLLEEIFYEDIPTETQVNDFLWFEDEYIFECLEINEDDDEEFLSFCEDHKCDDCKYKDCQTMHYCWIEFAKENGKYKDMI